MEEISINNKKIFFEKEQTKEDSKNDDTIYSFFIKKIEDEEKILPYHFIVNIMYEIKRYEIKCSSEELEKKVFKLFEKELLRQVTEKDFKPNLIKINKSNYKDLLEKI